MSEDLGPEAVAREYARALAEYVSGGSEAALTTAYELGRRAAGSGLGILDLAVLHHEALRALPTEGAGGRPAIAMAAQFLAESLSPFEMTLRSYRASARLLGLSETLTQQNVEIDRAREQLRTILDATTAVIYMKDADGRYLFVNRQYQDVFGLRRDEVLGRLDEELLPPEVARTLHGDDLRVLEARAPNELEEILAGRDGAHTYLSLKFPLLDPSGTPYGLCCVATDITERKRAEEAIQRAREAAEREHALKLRVQARDQFLAITSHELKTPLTSLELQVAGLRRLARTSPGAAITDDRVQSKCDVILSQVDRLTVLINNLIEVGRISAGHLSLSRERLDLVELARAVVDRSRDLIQRSGSPVTVEAPRPVVGTWDPVLLETVVSHLLSNALKFGDGKPVEVMVGATADHATLAVRDHGIGIPGEDQARIFERFERAVSERHFGGFGIGLWVARQAVEAHGGTLTVVSQHGAGAEFRVALPYREVEEPR
jgi:PAS domain S-box-containing protein